MSVTDSRTDLTSSDLTSSDPTSTGTIEPSDTGLNGIESINSLVERAQSGDPTAFRELHDRYAPRLRRFLAGRVPESHVDDIVNETFLRAWRNLASFRWQGRDIAAWLYTIARNLVSDHYGRRRTTHELPADDPGSLERNATHARGAEDLVIDLIEAERVRDAVRQLPPLQRQCVELRFLEERTVSETAHLMGRQHAAVRALQARALRSLAGSAR